LTSWIKYDEIIKKLVEFRKYFENLTRAWFIEIWMIYTDV